MSDQTTTDYVAVDLASNMTGIPARTLRYWIGTGKLAAVAGKRGKLVSVADVHRLASVAGRTAGNHNGHAGNGVASASNGAGNHAEPTAESFAANDTTLVRDGARAHLALIRDEWLLPFVDRLTALERENSRLEVERDQARREADELRARLEAPSPSTPESTLEPTPAPLPKPWWRFW